MDMISIACPDCESNVAEFAFFGEELAQWRSFTVQESKLDCVVQIDGRYGIRCSNKGCKWNNRILIHKFNRVLLQAVRRRQTLLVMDPNHLIELYQAYQANPSATFEAFDKPIKASSALQPSYINKIAPDVGRSAFRLAKRDRKS